MNRPATLALAMALVASPIALSSCKGHKSCQDLAKICEACGDPVTKANCTDYVQSGTAETCKAAIDQFKDTCK